VSFRPDTISSVMGAIVIEEGRGVSEGTRGERLQRLKRERLEDGEMEKWRTGKGRNLSARGSEPRALQTVSTSASAFYRTVYSRDTVNFYSVLLSSTPFITYYLTLFRVYTLLNITKCTQPERSGTE
jgi:hypothetical protein